MWYLIVSKIVSEYDQEIPQSQTADNIDLCTLTYLYDYVHAVILAVLKMFVYSCLSEQKPY